MTGSQLPRNPRSTPLYWVPVLLLALAWAYWPSLEQMVRRWSSDPQYTHGYVVPIFAAIVLWFRRDHFPHGRIAPSWWGLPLVALAAVSRLVGSLYSFEWLEAGSLVPMLAGLMLLAFGFPAVRWAWPGGAFLLFILPWPWQLDVLLTYPLRRIATTTSTYALQTMGVPALARGNIIVINELEVGVVEACSGLGMLMTFFALSTAVAFVIQRSRFDKIVVFLSAIPIGVLMNVVRITVTVFLYRVANPELARIIFHDVAGWVMMPLALAVTWLELCWLDKLWLAVERTGPVPVPVSTARDPVPVPIRPSWARQTAERVSCPREADRSLQEIPDVAP